MPAAREAYEKPFEFLLFNFAPVVPATFCDYSGPKWRLRWRVFWSHFAAAPVIDFLAGSRTPILYQKNSAAQQYDV